MWRAGAEKYPAGSEMSAPWREISTEPAIVAGDISVRPRERSKMSGDISVAAGERTLGPRDISPPAPDFSVRPWEFSSDPEIFRSDPGIFPKYPRTFPKYPRMFLAIPLHILSTLNIFHFNLQQLARFRRRSTLKIHLS
jgi:hypothetical protein